MRSLRLVIPGMMGTGANDAIAPMQAIAARRLREARRATGLTVEQAAEVLKFAPTTVWRREEGLVDLGPLAHLVALEALAAAKAA